MTRNAVARIGRLAAAAAAALALIGGVGSGVATSTSDTAGEVPRDVREPEAIGLERLRDRAIGPVEADFTGGAARSVIAEVATRGDTPIERATSYLEAFADLYGQQSPRTALVPVRRSGRGDVPSYVVFQQYVDGTEVHGGQITVFMDGSKILGTVGHLLTGDPSVGPDASVAQAHAIDVATEFVAGRDPAVVATPQLVIIETGRRPLEDGGWTPSDPKLAWRVAIDHDDPRVVFVDAAEGEVLADFGHDAHSHRLDLFDAKDTAGPKCALSMWYPPKIGDAAGVFPDFSGTPDAAEAVAEASAVYSFFHKTFGRDSYDNDGTRQRVAVRYATENTALSTHCDTLLFDTGAVVRDIYTHEFTHAVIKYTSDLEYSYQSGALNESFADIMGNLHEFISTPAQADWLIGEDTGGYFRNMADPPDAGHPDKMSDYVVTSDDNGGVHTNSGIHNKAAYLMAEGEIFNGMQVDPIDDTGAGRYDKLARLMYYTMTSLPKSFYTESKSGFRDARDVAMIYANKAAATAFRGWTVRDACTVRNAYAATEIAPATADTDCDGTLDDADADSDGDYIPNTTDNCPAISNPSQVNSDGGGAGDACGPNDDGDTLFDVDDNCPTVNTGTTQVPDSDGDGTGDWCEDFDGDTVYDPDDNCLTKPNAVQADADGDGIGDACDTDTDGDGYADAIDNCPFVANPSQADTDSGGIGDACDAFPNDDYNDKLIKVKKKLAVKITPKPDPIAIPIQLCKGACGERYFKLGQEIILDIAGLPRGTRAWVSDLEGQMVATTDARKPTTITWLTQGTGDLVLNVELPNGSPVSKATFTAEFAR
jgi:Zn-dependent metalloprotease